MSFRIGLVLQIQILLDKLLVKVKRYFFIKQLLRCDADEAFELIAAMKADLLLVDIALPGKNNGLSIGKWLPAEMHIPHIFTTAGLRRVATITLILPYRQSANLQSDLRSKSCSRYFIPWIFCKRTEVLL